MIEIQLSDDDRLDWALKSFKKKVQKAGILAELRRKRHYTKPSEARQLKAANARRRRRTAARGNAESIVRPDLRRCRLRPAARQRKRGRVSTDPAPLRCCVLPGCR